MIKQKRKTKSLDSFIKKLEKMYRKRPGSTLFFPLADAYKKAQMLDKAECVLRDGLVSYPKYWAAKALLGDILFSKGDIQGAKQELEIVVKIVPENMMACNTLLKVYEKIGFSEASEKDLTILQILKKDLFKHTEEDSGQFEKEKPVTGGTEDSLVMTEKKENQIPPPKASSAGEAEERKLAPIEVIEEYAGQEIVTATLAELYFSQGLVSKAVKIYKKLLDQQPERGDWADRLKEIQCMQDKKIQNTKTYTKVQKNFIKQEMGKKVLDEFNKWLKNCQQIKKARGYKPL